MKKLFFSLLPIGVIVGIWFIFASPYFLQKKIPYPSSYQVNFFHPWSQYRKFWGPVKNGAMSDVPGQIYPWRYFTITSLKQGEIPLWNPYSFSGTPHLANYQSSVFSPLNILFFFLPFIDAWSILVLIAPLLAGLFIYLFARSLRVSKEGALIASVSFMFCGFIVVWMAWGTLAVAISFLPLILYCIEKSFKKLSIPILFLLALLFPASFFSGHVQTSLYVLFFSLAFFLFRAVQTKKKNTILFTGLCIVFGLLLIAPQLLPSIELYLSAPRSGILNTREGIPFYYLVTAFAPDFFGNPVTRNAFWNSYIEWASFIGIIPLLFAFFSFLQLKNKSILFFFLAGIVSLFLAIDSPIQSLIIQLKIPVLSTVSPSRIIVLFSFSFAVLAGFGFDIFKQFVQSKKYHKLFAPFFLVGSLLILTWVVLLFFHPFLSEKLLISKKNLLPSSALFMVSLVCTSFSILLSKNKKILRVTLFVFILLVCFDSLRFALKWMPFDSRNLVYPNLEVIEAMKKNIGAGRVFGNLGGEVINYYALSGVTGYDPLYIKRYGEFMRSSSTGNLSDAERSVVHLDVHGEFVDRIIDFLDIALLFNPKEDIGKSWAYPAFANEEKFTNIYDDGTYQLYKNTTPLGRAALFYDYEVIPSEEQIIKRFYNTNFDFKKILIIEKNPSLTSKDMPKEGKKGNVSIISYKPNAASLMVSTNTPGLVFLSDNYYPGWVATVNKKEVPIYRADYSFRAVPVGKGESIVEFTYNPLSFIYGVSVACFGFILLLITSLFLKRVEKR